MNVNLEGKELNCLITNYHNITQNLVDLKKEIIIQIENQKEIKIKLDKNQRFIKCIKKPIDITIMEIIDEDRIKDEVSFLWYDLNYSLGYDNYFESDIFILQHPSGGETHLGIGKIINIEEFEFEHSIETEFGSSGSPVILISNNLVIGIHKQTNIKNNNGIGTFIGAIFKENDKYKKSNDCNIYEKEYCICKIYYESISNNEVILKNGSGFFCKIEDNKIPIKKALFTSNNILNENYIKKNSILRLNI